MVRNCYSKLSAFELISLNVGVRNCDLSCLHEDADNRYNLDHRRSDKWSMRGTSLASHCSLVRLTEGYRSLVGLGHEHLMLYALGSIICLLELRNGNMCFDWMEVLFTPWGLTYFNTVLTHPISYGWNYRVSLIHENLDDELKSCVYLEHFSLSYPVLHSCSPANFAIP